MKHMPWWPIIGSFGGTLFATGIIGALGVKDIGYSVMLGASGGLLGGMVGLILDEVRWRE